MKSTEKFITYPYTKIEAQAMLEKSNAFYKEMDRRRTVREFSSEAVSKSVIENIIKTASTAPSGAHMQPWTFCAISNADIKHQIRIAAEKEEEINYSSRMSETWLEDLKPFNTQPTKPFLDIAPWLIVVFKKTYREQNGKRLKNYYVSESVGIATGMLITAIHKAGLVTVTHTPSPMNFLHQILKRPENERPFLLLPVGYPAAGVKVPLIDRKPLEDISVFYE